MKAPFSGTGSDLLSFPLWNMIFMSLFTQHPLLHERRGSKYCNFSFLPEEGYSSPSPADLNEITEKCCMCCLNLTRSTLHKILFRSAAHISLPNHKWQKIIKNYVPQKRSLDLARGYFSGWVLSMGVVVLRNTSVSPQTTQPVTGMHLLVQHKFGNSVTCLFN